MPLKKILYTCYRCDYQTSVKMSMHRHLYLRNKLCCGSSHDVDLTDDMKGQIMKNRLYREPPPLAITPAIPSTSIVSVQNQQNNQNNKQINQIINNINQQRQIINIISTFDIGKKVSALAEREGVEILELDDVVEQLYSKISKKLQNNGFKNDVEYDDTHFKDMVSKITQQEEFSHSSVLFDDKKERFLFATGTNEWDTMRVKPGMEYIIDSLEKYHLRNYEVYLIRKIELERHTRLIESLDKYYSFMATFNVEPFVRNKSDATILYSDGGEDVDTSDVDGHRVVDKYNAKYINIRNNLTEAKKNATYKEVRNIVHQNILNNLDTINQRIADLIQIDPDFLDEIRPNKPRRDELDGVNLH